MSTWVRRAWTKRATLRDAVLALVGSSDAPLVIDTPDPDALEAALRAYPGRALVNSVNGDPASLASVLPLAERYGAAVVVLALDEHGIPGTAEERAAVVERVRVAARRAGLDDDDLVVDTLVMTAAADAEAPRVTLDALRMVHESGLATVLGVSNVSHGLPDRALLNSAFATAAAAAGLDAAIVNPNDSVVMEAIRLASQARHAGRRRGRAWGRLARLAGCVRGSARNRGVGSSIRAGGVRVAQRRRARSASAGSA